jgi:hypothetical protein
MPAVAMHPGPETRVASLIAWRWSSGSPYTDLASISGCGCFTP